MAGGEERRAAGRFSRYSEAEREGRKGRRTMLGAPFQSANTGRKGQRGAEVGRRGTTGKKTGRMLSSG